MRERDAHERNIVRLAGFPHVVCFSFVRRKSGDIRMGIC
jgi:hypothetical protein